MLSVRAACGGSGDRVFDAVGKSLRVGGHILGAASPKNEVLRPDQKFRIWTISRCNAGQNKSVGSDVPTSGYASREARRKI